MVRNPPPDRYAQIHIRKALYDKSMPRVKPNRQGMTRLFSFARPYWWQLGLMMLVTFITSSLNLSYPALMGTIIDSVVAKNISALHTIIFLLLGLAVAQALFSFGQN